MGDVSTIAITALLTSVGCEPEYLDEAFKALQGNIVSNSMSEVRQQAFDAVEAVRKSHQ
jgi:hypothetical protein